MNKCRMVGATCFEEVEVDRIYVHQFGRTMTAADNVWFNLISLGMNQVHFNSHYAEQTPYGRPIMASPFTLAVVTGLSTLDFGSFTMANLGWFDVLLPKPVFEGDTLYARSKILNKRASTSRPYAGIVEIQTEGFNQDGIVVIEYRRRLMMYREGHVPGHRVPQVVSSRLDAGGPADPEHAM